MAVGNESIAPFSPTNLFSGNSEDGFGVSTRQHGAQRHTTGTPARAAGTKLSLAIGVAACLLAATKGSATTITVPSGGAQANIGGCVNVSLSGVAFFNTPCTTANIFDAGSPDTGSYAGLTGGTIKNLLGQPVTGTLSTPIVDFTTFIATGGLVHFDLTSIDPGVGTNANCSNDAVGSVCTPNGSPFTLTQVASNRVSIALSLNGIAYLGSSGTGSNPTSALFTSQNLIPGTISGVLAEAFTQQGITDSYSATFSSTAAPAVPEPGSVVMLGTGILMTGLSLIRRRSVK